MFLVYKHKVGFSNVAFICLVLVNSVVFAETKQIDSSSQTLQLAPFIQKVLQQNPKILQTQAAWESSQSRISQVSAYPDPMLSYSLAPQTVFSDQTNYGQIITASQHLPWPGKQQLKGEIAQWQANAAQENMITTRLALIAASKIRYADWQFVHAAIRINEQNKILLEEFKNIAEIKYSAGRASKQDVLRAEVERTLLARKDEELTREKNIITSQINTLLNQKPDNHVSPPNIEFTRHVSIDITKLKEIVLRDHPQLKQINANVVASEKKLALAKQNFYPDVQLKASYNNLRMNTDNRFTLGIGINIPLQEKRQSAVDEASLNKRKLNWQKQALIAKIQNSLQMYYSRLTESEQIIQLYESRLLPLTDENLQAARSDYESGQGNFLDMITAEQNLIELQLQLAKTHANYQQHYALLEELSGGQEILQQASEKNKQGDKS